MPQPSLNANNKPSWIAKRIRGVAATFFPELREQEQGGITMTRYGVVKAVGGQFGEINGGNQFVIDRPGGGNTINPTNALENNKGFVYACMNAIAREVMTVEWRLFKSDGKEQKEQEEHEVLDLLDTVNDNMIGLVFKYLLSACLTLTGGAYVYLEGVKGPLDKPKAIHLMPPDKVTKVIDRRSWPYQLMGYKMRLDNRDMFFQPYEVIHLYLPNPANFFDGMSPVQAGAEYIDNDNYAQEFNRKFFRNGARPAGFLETEMVAETQIEALKFGFANMHEGIDNMNRIGVLPKGVKWSGTGASPKDMDFKNLSDDSKQRILAMFGVSRTILGTAESETNRSTAETADYVFSKRVVKPHMQLICAFMNEQLIPRYGDDIYLSFIDPVPEDRAARTDEMTKASGGVPVITQNEAREEFMGLGPVDGGDELLVPYTMVSAGSPKGDAGIDPDAEGPTAADKRVSKQMSKAIREKAANGERVAFRPVRLKFQARAKQRREMGTALAEKIKADLKYRLEHFTKKFGSTKEQDEIEWKRFSDYTHKTERAVAEAMQKLNGEQKAEVLANLPTATKKGINPADLFDVEKWIAITVDAISPLSESLFLHQAKQAAAEVGAEFDFTEATKEAVKRSVQMMAESYNQTTLATLETHINGGVQAGESLADITKRVEQIYEWSDTSRAQTVAKTESFRTANDALKTAWQQSGVVKTLKWYTANNPCEFCQEMDGKVIGIDDNFFENGQSLTVGEGDNAQTMSLDYGDVGAPPLHVSCMCFVRPEDISID